MKTLEHFSTKNNQH